METAVPIGELSQAELDFKGADSRVLAALLALAVCSSGLGNVDHLLSRESRSSASFGFLGFIRLLLQPRCPLLRSSLDSVP